MAGGTALKSGIWFTLSNFIVRGMGFITTPIFTRVMTKAEYGEFNNYSTWLSICTIVVGLNLESTLIRARFDYSDRLDDYVYSMAVLSLISTALWYCTVIVFQKAFMSLFAMDMRLIHSMFVYLLFHPAIILFQNVERFRYRYKWTVVSSLTVALSSSALSVFLSLHMDDSLMGRVLGTVIPVVIIGAITLLHFYSQSKRVIVEYWRQALPIALPFIPHLLSMMLLLGIDKVMIRRICGAEEVAVYSLAVTVGSIITILVTSVNSAYSPWLGEMLAKNKIEKIRRMSFPYVFFMSYISVGLVLVAPEVLRILGGTKYLEAIHVIPPITAGCLMQFIYTMYVNIEQYEKKTVGMAIASVIAASLNVLLNMLFIPRYGYIAAAYTTFMGYFSLLVMHVLLVKRIGRLAVYQDKKILLTGLGTTVLILVSTVVLGAKMKRYTLVIIYALILSVLLYTNRRVMLAFVRKRK